MTRETNPMSGLIAVEPFKSNSLERHLDRGVTIIDQRQTLTGLQVIFGNEKFHAGDVVFFEGNQCVQPWARRIYELGAEKFILAPVGNIIIVERRHEIPQFRLLPQGSR